jgi:hypothetical protein
MLICEGCSKGYHTDCINLVEVPSGDWFCEECTSQRRTKVPQQARRHSTPAASSDSVVVFYFAYSAKYIISQHFPVLSPSLAAALLTGNSEQAIYLNIGPTLRPKLLP